MLGEAAARGSGVFWGRSGVVLLRRAPQPLAGGHGLAWHGVVFASMFVEQQSECVEWWACMRVGSRICACARAQHASGQIRVRRRSRLKLLRICSLRLFRFHIRGL